MHKARSGGNASRDTLPVYSGEGENKAALWFDLSQGIERYAEREFMVPGVEIWLNTSPALNDENVTDAATEMLGWIRVKRGIREGQTATEDDDFWQVPYQNDMRNSFRMQIYSYVYDHSSGAFRAWLDDYKPIDVDYIREAAMREFGKVNRGTIQMWEAEFREGIPDKPGQPVFVEGCDFAMIKARLKKRQALLHHMCPLAMRSEYEFGNWNGDYARLKVYLTIGHCFRDVLNEQIRRAQQAATADGVEGVSNDYNDPDYERKWTGYMTVQSVEEAIEAKIEQDEMTNRALGKRGTSRSSGLPLLMFGGAQKNDDYHKGINCNRCGEEHYGILMQRGRMQGGGCG